VSNLTRCHGYCPEAGGTVTHTFRDGATVTIVYAGATATWTVGGRSGTIDLPCTPEPA
jgi:hypothetical protein